MSRAKKPKSSSSPEPSKLKKWRAHGTVIGTKFLGVFEAATKEEAVKLAEASAHVSVCHQCANEVDGAEIDTVEVEEDIE